MEKGKYDEYQLAKRHRIAYQTLIGVFGLILVNGYVKSSYGIWAEPHVESLVLVLLPGFYFASTSILQNAYFRMKDYPTITLLLAGFAMGFGLLIIGVFVFSGSFQLIENGKLGGDIELLLFTSLFSVMFLTLMIRQKLDSRT